MGVVFGGLGLLVVDDSVRVVVGILVVGSMPHIHE